MRYAPRALWLAAPALLASSLLTSCSSNPEKSTTTTEKTAVVVPAEANSASDSTAVTADSATATK